MALTPGTRLGIYEIQSAIGVGGMGEVYRAADTNLKRAVALKVLPSAVAGDAERLARFQREAEVLAALNHPNVAAIYGLEKSHGVTALVMELVDGPTLADRIRQGAVPIGEALTIARQIADALEAAHEQSIIHRDIKPANIKVRDDGTVKVLDFGLAKALEVSGAAPSAASVSMSPTITTPAMTQAGVILGTAGYMSPEQARGKATDRRTDIWSFGVIVFEMISGTRAFDGETISDVLAKVIEREPDWTKLPPSTPGPVRSLVRRCLRKDPKMRLQAIGDARLEIQEIIEGRETDEPPAEGNGRNARRRVAWLTGTLVAIVGVGVLAVAALLRPAPTGLSTSRFTVLPPQGWRVSNSQMTAGTSVPLSISPNGRHIAFVARSVDGRDALWVRSLDALESRQLAGTDGSIAPFWSADSRFVGFAADGKLKKIDIGGGAAFAVCDVGPFRGATWSSENTILFATNIGGLQRVSAAGGAPARVTEPQPGEVYHTRPVFLPDGRHFLFRAMPSGETFVGSLDSNARTLAFRGTDSTNIAYSEGHVLFLRDRTLMAQPFDERGLRVIGDAFPVADQIQTQNPPGTGNAVGIFAASANGVIVFQAGGAISLPRLTWFNRSGERIGTVGDGALFQSLALSHDGRRAAVHINDPAQRNLDIWIIDLEHGGRTRLTFDPVEDTNPVWSPDDTHVFFASRKAKYRSLYQKAASGVGAEQLMFAGEADELPWMVSHDGRWLLFQVLSAKTGSDLWTLPLSGDKKPTALIATPFTETLAQLSPDSRWLAYTSNDSGQPQVYVVPFLGSGGKWMISPAGGRAPRWRADMKEIFYLDQNDTLVAADVAGGDNAFEYGAPHALFKSKITEVAPLYYYDVARDGQRFLMVTAPDDARPEQPITVVLNWHAEHTR